MAITIRECRLAPNASQTAFAATLGVSKESYRTWDSGRRRTPPQAILTKAQVLAAAVEASQLLPLRFREHVRASDRPAMPSWSTVPVDFDRAVRALRVELGLSQRKLAQRIGAAGKAVIYQWESRKRKPSPVPWARVLTLVRERPAAMQATGQGRATALLPPAAERMCRRARRNR